ncbi:MAG: sulfotransferase family 2 domain-containing protein, partial [Saprospiraceae bacterium]|nr:sulfotransferase family 2 domain-containing protein [Saprospiraceae bacterium]
TSVRKGLGMDGFGGHARWSDFARLLGKRFDRMTKVCFVRNPWSRFLSMYNYIRLEESYYHSTLNPEKALYGKHRLYDLLIQSSLSEAAHYLIEGRLKPYTDGFDLFDPQYAWTHDTDGHCRVDFIGRFETLEEDFTEVCKQLGLPCTGLPHVNRSEEIRDYRRHYDEESRHLIGIYYEKDIEAFHYTF